MKCTPAVNDSTCSQQQSATKPGGEETQDHFTRHIVGVVLERCFLGRPENAVTFLPKSISAARPRGGTEIWISYECIHQRWGMPGFESDRYADAIGCLFPHKRRVGRRTGILHFNAGINAESSSWAAALMLRSLGGLRARVSYKLSPLIITGWLVNCWHVLHNSFRQFIAESTAPPCTTPSR